ncbi:UNVERIFIED_CONTAM: hypothetical protein Sangu_3114400 [Sesamum angustifolium]|uniref:RNA-directed DNA polymerase n=1 Tax=Sesamum angustifolium TaxID=2727405 RepID=A0AAW2K5U5_9LAMI
MVDQTSLRNHVAELESQVKRMMELLGQAPESPPVALFSLMDTLHLRVETLQKTMGEWLDMLDKRVTSATEEASILTDAVDVRVDGVQAEVNLLKRVVGQDENCALCLRDCRLGLRRSQGVKDLLSVIAVADRLVDFWVANSSDLEKKKEDFGKEKGKFGKGWKDGKFKKKKHPELNALVAEADDDEGGSTRVNPLQLVSASQERPAKQKGLMYVGVQINGKAVIAMLDSGASHNFVADREIQKLGLTLAQHCNLIKEVNSEAKPIQGVACVELKVSAWIGKCNLMVVPLDDFDVILGMDFLLLANAMVIPYLNALFIADQNSTCFVQSTYLQDSVRSAEKKNSLISAMQVKAGLRYGEQTYLAALIEVNRMSVSKIVNPLKDLLRKDQKWELTFACDDAFRSLKQAISSQPVLKLPQFDKSFEVQIDASDRALGGVLVQDKRPVAFESCKLKDAELRYNIHEKEMTVVIHCLEAWRHYLLGTKFTVVTDNVANTYFKTQRKRSPKQARWQEFLGEFDFEWVYRPGKHNNIADVVSQKLVEEYVAALTVVEFDFLDQNRESSKMDAGYLKLTGFCTNGDVAPSFVEGTHDPQWAGHPGTNRMVALLARQYYWPRMEEDVEAYVRTCLVCQLDKEDRKKEARLLQPLSIPEVLWQSISMDFISGFLKVNGMASVLVVVDHFSKYGFSLLRPMLALLKQRLSCSLKMLLNILVFQKILLVIGMPGMSPFELACRQQPTTPHEISVQKTSGKCLAANRFAWSKQELLDEAKDSLAKAQCRIKKYADMGRRHVEFSGGNQVLLKLTPQIWKKISSKSVHRGLIPKYDRPFEDLLDTARQQTQRALPVIRKEFQKTMLKILDHRTMSQSKKNRRMDYLVHWSGEFEEKLDEYWAVREGRTLSVGVVCNPLLGWCSALVWQACASGRGTISAWSDIVMDSQVDGRSGCQAVVCAGRHAGHNRRTGLADACAELGSMAQNSAAVCVGRHAAHGGRTGLADARFELNSVA